MPTSDATELGDEQKFLTFIPADGNTISNKKLREQIREKLGWDAEKTESVRDKLVQKGLIQRGRGQFGTVKRATTTSMIAADQPRRREREDYPHFRSALESWAKNQGWKEFFIEHNPNQGRRRRGKTKSEKWTRPDFVVIGYSKYEYTPGVVRDIETFELKRDVSIAEMIKAVFETASHSRFATKSYLAVRRSENMDPEDLSRIESECQRFQIGFLLFAEADNDYENWDWRVEPVRKEPDPIEVEEFVNSQISKQGQASLRAGMR
jgi:hypothetical protein